MQEKNIKSRIEELEAKVEAGDAESAIAIGNIYREHFNNLEVVIFWYIKAIELNPNDASAYFNLGYTYSDKQDYLKAIDCYTKFIELNPTSAAAYNNLGNSYSDMQEYNQAIECYTKAIELNPNYAAYNGLGNVYSDMQEYNQAIEYYNKSIELDPNYAVAYNNLGYTYSNIQEYFKAIDYFTKSIELDHDYGTAYYNLGNTYHCLKDYKKAAKFYIDSYNLGFQKSLVTYSSLFYDGAIDYSEAESALLKTIEKYEEPEAYLELGKLYLVKGHLNEELALKYLLKAKEFGFDCEYEIKQIENQYDNEFINGIKKFTKTNSPSDMNAIREFTKSMSEMSLNY